jgi:hypothetical protein
MLTEQTVELFETTEANPNAKPVIDPSIVIKTVYCIFGIRKGDVEGRPDTLRQAIAWNGCSAA